MIIQSFILKMFLIQTRDKTLTVLRSLLQELSPEVQGGRIEFDIEATQDKSAEVRKVHVSLL